MKKAFSATLAILLAFCFMFTANANPIEFYEGLDYADVFIGRFNDYENTIKETFGHPLQGIGDFYYSGPIYSYSELDGASTPDWVLVQSYYRNFEDVFFNKTTFGDYTYIRDYDQIGPREYLIYEIESDTVYTLWEAYRHHLPGIENAFDYIYGYELAKTGDTNGDKVVNIKDVTYMQEYLTVFECGNSVTYFGANPHLFEYVADINCDNKVNIKDATMLQKYLAHILIPTVYDSMPATADSVEYTQVYLGELYTYRSFDMLVNNVQQWNSLPKNKGFYSEEDFEDKSVIYFNRTYVSEPVEIKLQGVYRDENTLYVKCSELYPAVDVDIPDGSYAYHYALEIDKKAAEGVEKLVIDIESRQELPEKLK